jgi:hypothetical protein
MSDVEKELLPELGAVKIRLIESKSPYLIRGLCFLKGYRNKRMNNVVCVLRAIEKLVCPILYSAHKEHFNAAHTCSNRYQSKEKIVEVLGPYTNNTRQGHNAIPH